MERDSQPGKGESSSGSSKPATTGQSRGTSEKWLLDRIDLFVYGGVSKLNLESVDARCLGVLTFIQFNQTSTNPSSTPLSIITRDADHIESPLHKLPLISVGREDNIISGTVNVLQHLISNGISERITLSPAQKAETEAFITTIEAKLEPVQLYNWWVTPKGDLPSIPHYTDRSFPLSYLLRRLHFNYIKNNRIKSFQNKFRYATPKAIYDKADRVYKLLSDRLGTSRYFYGTEPTMLDAVVYGHLALHLKSNVSESHHLLSRLKNYPNLLEFCKNISQNFWGKELDLETKLQGLADEEEREKEEALNRAREGEFGRIGGVNNVRGFVIVGGFMGSILLWSAYGSQIMRLFGRN